MFAVASCRRGSRPISSVLLTVAAAIVWLAWRMTRGRVPVAIWLGTLAAVAVSAFLTFQQRSAAMSRRPADAHELVRRVQLFTPGAGYRLGSDRGRPNHGSTLASKRV